MLRNLKVGAQHLTLSSCCFLTKKMAINTNNNDKNEELANIKNNVISAKRQRIFFFLVAKFLVCLFD